MSARRLAGAGLLRREGVFEEFGAAAQPPLLNYLSQGTFTRASVATHWDGTLLRRYGIDVLRQSPLSVSGRRAFVVEGPRTNYALHSNDHDNAVWVPSSVTVAPNEAGDPSGGSQADAIEYTAAAAAQLAQAGIAVPVSVNAYASRFIRQKAAFVDDTIQLSETDHVGGVSDNSQESSLVWQRLGVSFGNTGTPNTGLYSLRHRNGFAEARDLYVFGAQVEAASFASSLIETTAAAATRAQDNLKVTGIAGHAVFNVGFTIHLRPSFSSAEHVASGAEVRFISGLVSWYIRFTAASGAMLVSADLGVVATGAHTWSAGQDLTITVDWVAGTITRSGFTTGNGTTNIAAAGDWSGASTLQVGTTSALSSPYYGLITEPYPI